MKYIPKQRKRECLWYGRSQHVLFDHPLQFFVLEELVPWALQRAGEKDKSTQIITWFIYGLEETTRAIPEVLRGVLQRIDWGKTVLDSRKNKESAPIKVDSIRSKKDLKFCQSIGASTAAACHRLKWWSGLTAHKDSLTPSSWDSGLLTTRSWWPLALRGLVMCCKDNKMSGTCAAVDILWRKRLQFGLNRFQLNQLAAPS